MTHYLTRKDFFTSLTAFGAASLTPGNSMAQSPGSQSAMETKPGVVTDTEKFSDRVFDDTARVLCGALSYLGDRLGLFRAMVDLGACTASQLAAATRCNERLVFEWCKAMLAFEYLEYWLFHLHDCRL